ncbi:hypothetical protein G7078_05510 [Sphingomonas sinipercae]|uniref:Uncharacterized protein n=1 Tax=Sphingomonas sinipercae TaxID=2714944 RepID=A0A6G7ZN05_9SPHN|nr:hypothetical protein [Sphingomonas sinipercae]QIL02299.1 hypothetical protein G7078_05510 [Sphingomonas sinipercae]
MAKKATSGTTGAKASAKPKSSPKKASGSKAVTKPSARARSGGSTRNEGNGAADMLLKLLESPLVADLLAVGATAALAALTEHRYSARTGSGEGRGAKRALKGAVTAAAAAMGRRIANEFDEIKSAAKSKRDEAA